MNESVSDFEARVLEAIDALGDDAYGVPLRERLGVSYGTLYVTLERLEEAGHVTSREGEATPERGGRPKRYWTITRTGRKALRHRALAELTQLSQQWGMGY